MVIPRVINGFIKKIVFRRDVLRTVDLAITGDCHYKCVFCSASLLYQRRGPYLSVEQIKEIWRQCVDLGAIHVNLTGGEPLYRDLKEICRIIKNFGPHRYLVSLVSNGLLVNKEMLNRLKDAGLDTLQLSLESMEAQKHDQMVGIPNSYHKVMQAIREAKAIGLNVCLNVVIYRENINELLDLMAFCTREDIFLVLNTAATTGNWINNSAKRLTQADETVFDRLLRNGRVRHDSSVNFSARRECPGGKERIHITAYGDVLTCPLVPVSYGNVLQESLQDIYVRMNRFPHIKKYNRHCKQAFDKEYFQNILNSIQDNKKLPVLATEVFKRG